MRRTVTMHESGLNDAASERAASVAREFDAKAARYETDRLAGWYRAQAEETLRHLRPEPGTTVLDIGCGTGWLLRRLVREHPDVSGIGIDLSRLMIDAAERRTDEASRSRLRFLHADWAELDPVALAPGPIAAVVCVSAFHYFADPLRACVKARRALSPGGRFLLLDRALDASPLTVLWQRLHDRILRDHVTFYRTDELTRLLEGAGFRDVAVRVRIRRLFWEGKLYTSLALLEAVASRRSGQSRRQGDPE